jgi:hypothetical protein
MSENIQVILINGCVTIFGILISALISGNLSYKAAMNSVSHQSRATALAKLRSVFSHAIAEIKLCEKYRELVGLINNLKKQLPQHAAAIEEFRPFIVRDKKLYQLSWDKYNSKLYISDLLRIGSIGLADDGPRIAGYSSIKENEELRKEKDELISALSNILETAAKGSE